MKTIKFKQWDCKPQTGYYGNGRKALMLVDSIDFDPIATATVNPENDYPADNTVFVKDYSENEGMTQSLIDAGIIFPEPVYTEARPWVNIFAYALTEEGLKLWEDKK